MSKRKRAGGGGGVADEGEGHPAATASSSLSEDEEAEEQLLAAAAASAAQEDQQQERTPAATAAAAAAAAGGEAGGEADGEAGADETSSSAAGAAARASSTSKGPPASRWKYAVVCSSNVNRSMEAHVAFFNHKLRVGSFGAGRFVRLPMPGAQEGRAFEFGTPYADMLAEMEAKAENNSKAQEFYKRTKLLDILRRNKQIKRAPERWQDLDPEALASFDVVICFEQRIFDAVIEDLLGREPRDLDPVVVLNLETKDDPKEAIIAGRAAVRLAQQLEQCEDLGSEAPDVVERFMAAEERRLLFQIHYL